MVLACVNEGRFLRKFNFTLITLIPNVPHPVEITQFRPITLCTTTTKLVAKLLAERLKLVLGTIVSKSQSAFVPNRLITDNILLVYEVHHFIKLKKMGKKGFMSIKLDMQKAYDRIEWSFFRLMMTQLHFPDKWISLIMLYIESVSYSLLINGDQVGYFKPGRGFRQGIPSLLIYSLFVRKDLSHSLMKQSPEGYYQA
ncbi:hypothetical protein LIER_42691 [Lithospermum erythrorhizon]|uniref:Reverse transcriptase domain-containing protein n=1 Tax=Lithospermum erythrorhizon TaxID=34254 RepID=A0AAV3NRY0_LITER